MTPDDDGAAAPVRPEPSEPSETQEQRAERAITAIVAGGDLTTEAMTLSNEFTDRQTERLRAWLRRLLRRSSDEPRAR